MGCEENIKFIEKFYDEVYKKNQIDSFDKYCSPDAVIQDPSIPFKDPNLEQFKQLEAESSEPSRIKNRSCTILLRPIIKW